ETLLVPVAEAIAGLLAEADFTLVRKPHEGGRVSRAPALCQLAQGRRSQRAMDGLERLARFEQLCSLGGEIGHLAREDVALAIERIERAAQIIGMVAGRLELTGEALLFGQAVRQRP